MQLNQPQSIESGPDYYNRLFASAQKQFQQEHEALVARLSSPESQSRLKRVREGQELTRTEKGKHLGAKTGIWEMLPNETFDESVKRYADAFIASHKNQDCRATNEPDAPADLTGYGASKSSKPPSSFSLPPNNSILGCFMPVIVPELAEQEHDVDRIAQDFKIQHQTDMVVEDEEEPPMLVESDPCPTHLLQQ